jgi:hypothetical protein
MLDYSSNSATMTLTLPETAANGETGTNLPCGGVELLARERDLPHGIGELQEHWRELPPTVSVEQLLGARWLGDFSRAPMYRALQSGTIPSVSINRRKFILVVPLLRLLGVIEIDDRP